MIAAAEPTRHIYHLGDHIVEMYEDEDSQSFELLTPGSEENSFMRIYQVIPGIRAAFYEYNSPYCHAFNDMAIVRDIVGDVPKPRKMFEINMCREGSFHVVFSKRRSFTALLQGDISLAVTEISDWARTPGGSSQTNWVLDLPTNRYRGLGLIVDLATVEAESRYLLAQLDIDLKRLIGTYSLNDQVFIMAQDRGIEKTIDSIEFHRENASISLLRLSVLELLARIGARAIPPQSLARPECSLETLRLTREARNHAVTHLRERYTIDDISRKVGMSPTVFKNAFREIYGQPYARYMTSTRMEQASELLAEGELILAVAETVGYESPSKFTAAFKRVVGESPSTYRERMRAYK